MKSTLAVISALLGAVLVNGLSTETASAQQWFACANGYEIQTNRGRYRCVRPGQRQRVQPDAGCPVGTTFNQDYRGNTDYCLPVGGTVVGRASSAQCAPNVSVDRRRGRDRCFRTTRQTIRPVDAPAS